MSVSIRRILLSLPLIYSMTHINASPININDQQPQIADVAEECRQIALKIDWISRFQERLLCMQYLDGGQVYFASKYITTGRIADAIQLVEHAIIQTSFAIDVDCHGQSEMEAILLSLQVLKKELLQLTA